MASLLACDVRTASAGLRRPDGGYEARTVAPATMIPIDPGQDESTSDPGLHSLLRGRFSPLTFDPDHKLVPAQVDLLLEAARWAPSAGNSQPWAFFIALR